MYDDVFKYFKTIRKFFRPPCSYYQFEVTRNFRTFTNAFETKVGKLTKDVNLTFKMSPQFFKMFYTLLPESESWLRNNIVIIDLSGYILEWKFDSLGYLLLYSFIIISIGLFIILHTHLT